MRIHFVGIGGEGMCGLAKLAILQGHIVSGSELEDKASLSELSRLGANVFRNHFAEHVQTADLVVRSSAIVPSHVEVQAAVRFGIRVMKRSECLGLLLKASGQKVIRIAGSHGKSTLTAMIGTVLRSAGLDPTIIVGAYVPVVQSCCSWSGQYAVVESCEFDRSF
jgi:UDP-N-acetylmuramate--alanine ligase